MPITFNCTCGKSLRVADEHAGKRIKCPGCQAVCTAPAPKAEPKFEVVEDEPQERLAAPAPAKARPKPAAKPQPRDEEDDDPGFTVEEDEEEKPKPKKKLNFSKGTRRDEVDEDEEEDEKPRPKKKRPRRDEDDDDEDERPKRRRPSNPEAGKQIMYVIGGAVLAVVGIAIAVFWWQTGPHTGRRPYSGYILGGCFVVVGIGTAIKGITGNFDEDE